MGVDGKKGAVGGAAGGMAARGVAAVGGAMLEKPRRDSLPDAVGKHGRRLRGPGPGQAAAVDEIEAAASAIAREPLARGDDLRRLWIEGIEGHERIERKRAVVEIAPATAIDVAAAGGRRAMEERGDEVGGIAERPPRETRDLEHLESLAHGARPLTPDRRRLRLAPPREHSPWLPLPSSRVAAVPAPLRGNSLRTKPRRKSSRGRGASDL